MFPQNKNEVLAMLYLQTCNLSSYSPEEIAEEFEDALIKIEAYYKNINADYDKDHEFVGATVNHH